MDAIFAPSASSRGAPGPCEAGDLKLRAMTVTVNNVQMAAMPTDQISDNFQPQAGAVRLARTGHMRHEGEGRAPHRAGPGRYR